MCEWKSQLTKLCSGWTGNNPENKSTPLREKIGEIGYDQNPEMEKFFRVFFKKEIEIERVKCMSMK